MQKKTGRPVQPEITEQTREKVLQWIRQSNRGSGEYLFPRRVGSESTSLSPSGTASAAWTNGQARLARMPCCTARTRYAGRRSP
jgi:hypothetical protein